MYTFTALCDVAKTKIYIMKDTISKLFATAALLVTCACQEAMYYEEEAVEGSESTKKAVIFSGNIQTRMVNNMWETDDRIGIYMLKAGETLSKESILTNSSNRKYIYSGNENSFTPETKNDTLFYPQTGEAVDFIAYYPYKSVRNYGMNIDVSNQTQPSAIDLLYSNNLKAISKSDQVLSLQFKHQLSKLVFFLSVGEGFGKEDLSGLKLTVSDVLTKGHFSLSNADLSELSSKKEIEALVNAEGTQAEAIVLPQPCYKKRVKVTLASGRGFLFEIVSTEEWKHTSKYTYHITLKKDNHAVGGIEGSVEDWTDGGSSELEQPDNSGQIWDGTTVDTDWYAPTKSSFDLITAAELAGLSKLVRDGESFKGKTIYLLADINLNYHPWTPIGCLKEHQFEGTFNGTNHTVSGLSPQPVDGGMVLGLFGDNIGIIQNVMVDGNAEWEGSMETCCVAGIAGINRGIIEGCRNSVSVSGISAIIAESATESKTKSKSILYEGGVAGANYGTITGCQNEGYIEGENRSTGVSSCIYIGGVAGINASVISYSENNQDISCKGDSVYAGGLTGAVTYSLNGSSKVYGEVRSCHNYGTINITEATGKAIAGGIVGRMEGGEIRSSYNHAEVISTLSSDKVYAKTGGIAGENEGGTLSACTNKAVVTARNTSVESNAAAGGIVGNNAKGGKIHTCITCSTVQVVTQGHAGGIAGYNQEKTNTHVYSCCINEGMLSKWIGNAEGSDDQSGVTKENHTDE